MTPTRQDLREVFEWKYGDARDVGWAPRLRRRFGYFTPDDWYEAIVSHLVTPGSAWLDVGCGHQIFPSNAALAEVLASRSGFLMGVDPDDTIHDNSLLHARVQGRIEDVALDRTFDVITMRMVAEHLDDPIRSVAKLWKLTKSGGHVVIYTINRYSPVPIVTWLTPFWFHHPIKRMLWRTERRDTFPVAYRMNTRKTLRGLFEDAGFRECAFLYLGDCRTLARFWAGHALELACWYVLNRLGLRYPEGCLLGVYERR